MKKKSGKISRGYRLERSTHNLIKILKRITGQNTDAVISGSCGLYLKEVTAGKQNLNSTNKIKEQ